MTVPEVPTTRVEVVTIPALILDPELSSRYVVEVRAPLTLTCAAVTSLSKIAPFSTYRAVLRLWDNPLL